MRASRSRSSIRTESCSAYFVNRMRQCLDSTFRFRKLARRRSIQAATPVLGGAAPCTSIPNLPNGIQIFPGSVPLYKNGVLVGAIGISGDGVDQDDLIAAGGGAGFAPPVNIRSDQVLVRGVRLPFLKFPRSPNL